MDSSSPSKAWSRTFAKYSPTRNVRLSPVINIQGKVKPVYLNDDLVDTLTWLVETSEESYYQNILELLSLHESGLSSINKLLRKNRLLNYWPNILVNFENIGKGAFGKVYKAQDKITGQVYAVKEITSTSDNSLYNLLIVLLERNAYVRANESAFVVKLLGAFQDQTSNWMVFEYCIGDLHKYLSDIHIPAVTFMNKFIEENVMQGLYNAYKVRLSLDVEETAFIYSFELLAGLDYMSKRNLIHRDLKPDNILVSSLGHLKIGDLGLSQRLRWIDRKSSLNMVEPSDLKDLESKDAINTFAGNIAYSDPQLIIYYQLGIRAKYVYKYIQSSSFPIINGDQDFLTDLYAVSLIIMELLFAGMNFITTERFTEDIAEDFHIRMNSINNVALFKIRCIYDDDVRVNYLYRILNKQTNTENSTLMEFLKSCYRPKKERALNYTKRIQYYERKLLVRNRCIDLDKIELLDLYKKRNITRFNVNRRRIDDTVLHLFTKSDPEIDALTFQDLQEEINKDGSYGMQIPSFQFVD